MNLIQCWWECKLVQTLQKRVLQKFVPLSLFPHYSLQSKNLNSQIYMKRSQTIYMSSCHLYHGQALGETKLNSNKLIQNDDLQEKDLYGVRNEQRVYWRMENSKYTFGHVLFLILAGFMSVSEINFANYLFKKCEALLTQHIQC